MKTDQEWIDWGRADPLYAVAAWPGRSREGARPWTEEEFYKLGESDWSDFAEHWRRYGVDTESCLEIGCGAGRLTRQIAGMLGRVEAIDVSAEQMAIAQRAVAGSNVGFHLKQGASIPLADGAVSACFTAHVLQHLDSREDLAAYAAEIARVLRKGGTLMAHLPLYQLSIDSGPFNGAARAVFGARRMLQNLRTAYLRRRHRLTMRYTHFEIGWLRTMLASVGFERVEALGFEVKSNHDWHWFVLATHR